MNNGLVCLLAEGLPLTDSIRDTLIKTAAQIINDRRKRLTFMDDASSGEVYTRGIRRTFGGFTGIEFYAELAAAGREGRVKFILDDRVAEKVLGEDWDGAWLPISGPSSSEEEEGEAWKNL